MDETALRFLLLGDRGRGEKTSFANNSTTLILVSLATSSGVMQRVIFDAKTSSGVRLREPGHLRTDQYTENLWRQVHKLVEFLKTVDHTLDDGEEMDHALQRTPEEFWKRALVEILNMKMQYIGRSTTSCLLPRKPEEVVQSYTAMPGCKGVR